MRERPRLRYALAPTLLTAIAACQDPGDVSAGATAVDGPRMGQLADGSIAGTYVARMARRLDGSASLQHHLILPADPDHPDRGVDLELVVPESLAAVGQPAFDRNTTLRVWGERDGLPAAPSIHVDEWTVLAPAPEPLIDAEPFAPRVLATILLFWEQPGLNNGNAEQSMFAGAEATSVFYGEVSYGRERVIGEVFGPYQIPDPGGCDPYSIGVDARAAMLEKGHNPNDYQQLMYHFPSTGCDFSGLADLGSPSFPARDSWYHDSFGCTVRNQEIGHNYGMGHSHAYDCGIDEMGEEIIFADNCEHIEYGDPYDPMGDGCAHINAVQKTYMGWLDGCNIVDATADGTFNIVPLETPCNGTQALRVPAFDGRAYWLEYRQPIGAFDGDAGLDGVVVHVSDEVENDSFGPAPYYLDINGNGLMLAGDSFTDPDGTVTFTIVEANPTHAVVSVVFPGGGAGAPSCRGGGAPELVGEAYGTLECARGPYPADDTPPVVTITSPADGDQFEPGADFVITAEATDDRILSDVELYLDSEPVVRLFEPPWTWDVTNIAAGTYEFGVVARDGRNMGISQAVTIVVGSPEGPATTGAADTSGGLADGTDGDEGSSGSAGETELDDDGCGCGQSGDGRDRGTPWWVGTIVLLRRRRNSA
jgi:hypothetical protein